MTRRTILLLLSGATLLLHATAPATIDNHHFYRASMLFSEPRMGKPWLASLDVSVGGGSATCSFDGSSRKRPLFDLYGTHNMQKLAVGVPGKDLSNPLDAIIEDLSLITAQGSFATFSIGGKLSLLETYFNYTQNFSHGIFAQLNLPIRRTKVDGICFNDLSPVECACPTVSNPTWQAFLNNFDAILARYCLKKDRYSKTGVGDLAVLLGWTHNYHDNDTLDYIDTTFKIGMLAPTGALRNEDHLFSLAHGNDGHVGIPFSLDVAIGACEWITLATHLEATFFAQKQRILRINTAEGQSNIIMLAKAGATVEKGSLWAAGLALKADHVIRGLSVTTGYTFAHKAGDRLTLCDNSCRVASSALCNERLQDWHMHTFHLQVEYDLTHYDAFFGPRIGIFYNHEISGKRTMKMNMAGGCCGIECAFNF